MISFLQLFLFILLLIKSSFAIAAYKAQYSLLKHFLPEAFALECFLHGIREYIYIFYYLFIYFFITKALNDSFKSS